jgi:hypothetical protein
VLLLLLISIVNGAIKGKQWRMRDAMEPLDMRSLSAEARHRIRMSTPRQSELLQIVCELEEQRLYVMKLDPNLETMNNEHEQTQSMIRAIVEELGHDASSLFQASACGHFSLLGNPYINGLIQSKPRKPISWYTSTERH